ncbi:MAG: LemA family protein [Candidatus Vogelbacteria bacterium]|nr:LemA family protein [Candidatus Vogelbacteria bacterium]
MSTLYIVLGIIVFLLIIIVFVYNRFVALTIRVKEAWADIDVQLKRRYDLIPNLVETVKSYATHERETFDRVTTARAKALSAGSVVEHGEAENMLTGALKSLFAVAEAYPDLKANQNFLELQRELADTENKIQAARRFYNGNVRDLNVLVGSFPSNLIAGIFGFKVSDFFELEEAVAKNPVPVSF